MPLVRVDMPAGRSPEVRAALGDAIQQALHDALGVPLAERFQVIAEHPPGGLVVDPGYLGIARSAEAVIVQVTLNRGRDAASKRHFHATLADALQAATGMRREDLVVSLVEAGPEDWSFGNGDAQLA
ncbi:tautomerase family protein [Lichenibacterium ramalinae]|uniref:Tautomerase family protein n=1 Tax=Lichenibacterium ramalinae TaxID=2316527 RepID=A0A4Q2R7G3_9HYPH|nr:tautomerase family protein [Lichenibacterium ramalinae]RYB01683.1 tautomerase family protein [Lichenibacterium ramalinae]